jgi:hypothetical protein
MLLVGLAGSAGAEPDTRIVAMEDQFHRTHRPADHRGDVLVLIYGDRGSADANRALGEWLHVHFHPAAQGQPPGKARLAPVKPLANLPAGGRSPDVVVVPIACIGEVPGVVRTLIAGQFRRGSPDVPVWLDFTGVMKKNYGLKEAHPNVAVFDTQGQYRLCWTAPPRGPITPQQHNDLAASIEAIRREILTSPMKPN